MHRFADRSRLKKCLIGHGNFAFRIGHSIMLHPIDFVMVDHGNAHPFDAKHRHPGFHSRVQALFREKAFYTNLTFHQLNPGFPAFRDGFCNNCIPVFHLPCPKHQSGQSHQNQQGSDDQPEECPGKELVSSKAKLKSHIVQEGSQSKIAQCPIDRVHHRVGLVVSFDHLHGRIAIGQQIAKVPAHCDQ